MSWRDNLVPGSWRGVPVEFVDDNATVGRRVTVHEYPARDDPWPEDLGRAHRVFTFNGYVVGPDYQAARDELEAVCEKDGEGVLVHPRRGTKTWKLLTCSLRESVREGGRCSFTLSLVEPGENQFPAVQEQTSALVDQAADAVSVSTIDDFAANFGVGQLPQFVADDALAVLHRGVSGLRLLNGQISSAIAPIGDVAAQINEFSDQLTELIHQPRTLAGRVVGLVRSALGSVKNVDRALNGYRSFEAVFHSLNVVPTTTPTRRMQASNRQAVHSLFVSAGLAEVTRQVAVLSAGLNVESNIESPFDSYNHAIAVRDELSERIDDELQVADYTTFSALSTLSSLLVKHVSAHGARLERIEALELVTPEPAEVIAWRLYGGIDRAEDIVRRNKVTHAGFVPANTPLEVLSA